MEITIKLRDAYGRTLIDPVCAKAKILANIAGTSTLTLETVKNAAELGFKVVVMDGHKPEWLRNIDA
jgi:hypothetical protein